MVSFTANTCLMQRSPSLGFCTQTEQEKLVEGSANAPPPSSQGCIDCRGLKTTPVLPSLPWWLQVFMQSHPSLVTEGIGAFIPG